MSDCDDGLTVADFGRVNGRVEKVERHTLTGQVRCFVVGDETGVRKLMIDLDQTIQTIEV